MPFTWRINIKRKKPKGPVVFEFDQDPDILIGDQIIWSNADNEAHFPAPSRFTDPNGKASKPKFRFMSHQIAPQSTSPSFTPSKAGTFEYICSLHPEAPTEKGSFTVGPQAGDDPEES